MKTDGRSIAKIEEILISENLRNSFEVFEINIDMLNIDDIYYVLKAITPKVEIQYNQFDVEMLIGCETVCSAICHSINWDFLRKAVYKKTIENPIWITPEYLSNISVKEIESLLEGYEKVERIRATERSRLLRDLGRCMCNKKIDYTEIFFYDNFKIREYKDILACLKSFSAFSNDPEGKKIQLLLQCLSDYIGFETLNEYYRPTIDYHLLRVFLRRGIVFPTNQYAREFIFKEEIERKEVTIGALRNVCAVALQKLSTLTYVGLKEINRIEWWIGRTICKEGKPDCCLKSSEGKWLKDNFNKCPYFNHCIAGKYNRQYLMINEPTYKGNSY